MSYWTPGKAKTAKLHVPVTGDMAQRLEALARQARISKAEAARRALERGIPSLEREIEDRHRTFTKLTTEAKND